MPEYVKDSNDTKARLAELVEAQRFAAYELAAAVALLRAIGEPWEFIGEGMGYKEGGRKQGASQWNRRNGLEVAALDETERRRVARVLGLGARQARYQVRLVIDGRHGVSRVVYRHVSTHLSREVAEDRARRLEGAAEVWCVDPNGTEQRMSIRRPQPARSSF